MANVVSCEVCSAQYQARDEHAGKKLRCKKCGHVMQIPPRAEAPPPPPVHAPLAYPQEFASFQPPEDSAAHEEMYRSAPSGFVLPTGELAVAGKPASIWGAMLVPATFGRTTLRLSPRRVTEDTRRPIIRRYCEFSLTEVDSAELNAQGNPIWLALGALAVFMTTPIAMANRVLGGVMLGLAILFVVLYFIVKHRYLIVRSRSNALAIFLRGDDAPYHAFMQAVLGAAENARAHQR
jgi:DNA-directed RNA polymerase subunit RPC12/RpoP